MSKTYSGKNEYIFKPDNNKRIQERQGNFVGSAVLKEIENKVYSIETEKVYSPSVNSLLNKSLLNTSGFEGNFFRPNPHVPAKHRLNRSSICDMKENINSCYESDPRLNRKRTSPIKLSQTYTFENKNRNYVPDSRESRENSVMSREGLSITEGSASSTEKHNFIKPKNEKRECHNLNRSSSANHSRKSSALKQNSSGKFVKKRFENDEYSSPSMEYSNEKGYTSKNTSQRDFFQRLREFNKNAGLEVEEEKYGKDEDLLDFGSNACTDSNSHKQKADKVRKSETSQFSPSNNFIENGRRRPVEGAGRSSDESRRLTVADLSKKNPSALKQEREKNRILEERLDKKEKLLNEMRNFFNELYKTYEVDMKKCEEEKQEITREYEQKLERMRAKLLKLQQKNDILHQTTSQQRNELDTEKQFLKEIQTGSTEITEKQIKKIKTLEKENDELINELKRINCQFDFVQKKRDDLEGRMKEYEETERILNERGRLVEERCCGLEREREDAERLLIEQEKMMSKLLHEKEEFNNELETMSKELENKRQVIEKLKKVKEEYKTKYGKVKKDNKALSLTLKRNEEDFKLKLDRTFDEVKEMRNETMFTMKSKLKTHEELIEELREENKKLKDAINNFNQTNGSIINKNESGIAVPGNKRRQSNGGQKSMDFKMKSFNDISGLSNFNNDASLVGDNGNLNVSFIGNNTNAQVLLEKIRKELKLSSFNGDDYLGEIKEFARARKFSESCIELVNGFRPEKQQNSKEITLKEVWKWIKTLLEEYKELKLRENKVLQTLRKKTAINQREDINRAADELISKTHIMEAIISRMKSLLNLPEGLQLEELLRSLGKDFK